MKLTTLALLVAPLGAVASLNCTVTAPLKAYCCPDRNSEVVKEYPVGRVALLGCAADDKRDGRWFWNYNNLFTPDTRNVKDCVLNTWRFPNTDVLPDCGVDDYVLRLTRGKRGPLDECDPKCVTNNNIPTQFYFGDS
ncbi:hypothetical protein BJ508DRAFT_343204 [Ascobolus immersus RN42]|uniref:Secreted protein n=1 Tax=Ascobolus immersus RN42 TaxID=1160509 RepID=A0A3N4ICH9_ASCIM|nr:hypothetical protein BJ508DRAFT_343204 [Ascobolus immersus RN42]